MRLTKLRTALAATIATAVLATGCSAAGDTTATATAATTSVVTTADGSSTTTVTADDLIGDNSSYESTAEETYDESSVVDVTLDGDTATSDSDAVTVADDGTVTIGAAGSYRLSGTLTGQVVVDTEDAGTVRLILDGVDISSDTTAAIAFMNADAAAVVLAEGSENSLSDATSYVYPDSDTDEPNAALFSTADLTISGAGSLNVTGNSNDAIASKDGLVVDGATISVDAVDDGVRGKDYVVVESGSLTVTAGGDGVKSDNDSDATAGYVLIAGGTLDITAGDDGIDAQTDLAIADGTVTVARSEEGLEAQVIVIDGGTTTVTSSDDGINASAGSTAEETDSGGMGGEMSEEESLHLYVNGGTLAVDAEGDGLDSNGSITITGGTTTVDGPTSSGNGALDSNGTIEIAGGTLTAFGSSGMAESPDTGSAQSFVAATFDTRAAGTEVSVVDAAGTVVATYTAAKEFASLIYSSADLVAGESYTVTADGTTLTTVTAGEATAGGQGGGGDFGGGGPGGGGPGGER